MLSQQQHDRKIRKKKDDAFDKELAEDGFLKVTNNKDCDAGEGEGCDHKKVCMCISNTKWLI